MAMDQSDEDIARLLRDLHLPPEALHELAEALSLTDALTEAGAPPTFTNDVLSTFTAPLHSLGIQYSRRSHTRY